LGQPFSPKTGVRFSVTGITSTELKRIEQTLADEVLIVDLGAGIDSGFYRVAPPPSVDRYSVDLPGIMALRDEVLPANPHSHSVPVSLADEHWPDAIPADLPTMLVADGLFAFLTEPQIIAISRGITDHFASGELAFDDYGCIGWLSRVAIKLYPQKMFQRRRKPVGLPGIQDMGKTKSGARKARVLRCRF
jgi:O-methyltransferase involved in polyketide biosynthesis